MMAVSPLLGAEMHACTARCIVRQRYTESGQSLQQPATLASPAFWSDLVAALVSEV